MSTTEETKTSDTTQTKTVSDQAKTLVDTLFDLGTAWAEHGIGYGKFALESSARMLGETAKVLEALQQRIRNDQSPKAG